MSQVRRVAAVMGIAMNTSSCCAYGHNAGLSVGRVNGETKFQGFCL